MTRQKIAAYALPLIAIAALAALLAYNRHSDKGTTYHKDSDFIFGTAYNVTYESDEDLKQDINTTLLAVDSTLSPFNKQSIITAVNQNKDTELNSLFIDVFNKAAEVYADTEGAFDITVAPLVNAWGFGFKNGQMPTQEQVDSIRQFIGFSKVSLKGSRITKQDPRIMLDCGAIAKGYAVDQVARMLDSKGVKNYMVEIGGEIVTKGVNPNKEPWHIGVVKPVDDSLYVNNELQTRLALKDVAMATSGNYRNYYYKDGKKYAHTIDPKTGYPIQHNILSATVLAPTCAQADAYATAFMVLGIDKAKQILSRHKEMKAYLIYNDDKGDYSVWFSPELEKNIIKE